MITGFVGGHVVSSIGAPIAVADSLAPARRHEAWLRPFGLVLMVLLWALGAATVVADTLHEETFGSLWGKAL